MATMTEQMMVEKLETIRAHRCTNRKYTPYHPLYFTFLTRFFHTHHLFWRLFLHIRVYDGLLRNQERKKKKRLMTMRSIKFCLIFVVAILGNGIANVLSFLLLQPSFHDRHVATTKTKTSLYASSPSRRQFAIDTVTKIVQTTIVPTILLLNIQSANALPMITPEEFNTILRDSARSIDVVEFSGPRSENIRVKLVDGTSFGIKDIVESSTDPRSPLKIVATCREYKVRTKFIDLEAALTSTPKKKVVYYNARVQEAAIKEREKEVRIQNDEMNRVAELQRMGQQ